MKKSGKSTIIQVIVFLGIGIALIFWQYRSMDPDQRDEMFAAIQQVRLIYFLPGLLIGFLSHYFRALRWKLLMQPVHIYPATANSIFAVLTGYLVNALIPRMGEVAKCTVLAKYEKVPVDKLLGTILAERAFDTVCLLVIFLITLLSQYDIIAPFAWDLYRKIFFDAAGNFILMRIVLFVLACVIVLAASLFFYRKIKDTKIGKIIARVGDGLKAIVQVRQKALFLLYTILIWTMYTMMAILGFYMLPDMAGLPWLAGLSIITFGSVAMIVTPGGLGAFPPVVASILLLYGIAQPLGIAYGWVNWSMQTLIVLLLGIFSLVFLPVYNRKRHVS